jgi:hypothetical protein
MNITASELEVEAGHPAIEGRPHFP